MDYFNKKECGECFDFLEHEVETEIRCIDPKKKKTPFSIFVKDRLNFIKTCEKYNGQYNLYAGINERKKGGTQGEDVISIKTIVIDIDAIRKNGFEKQSATIKELKDAEKICDSILTSIQKTNQILPTKLCSGNGYQLWFAIPKIQIDNKNRKEIESKIQMFHEKIINKFDINGAIDKIGDLPRIIKIWGTLNIKGDNPLERPHRIATIIGEERFRRENIELKNSILKLEPKKITEYVEEKLEKIDMIKIPPCINYLLNNYQNKDGNYWYRIIQFIASFFMSIGLKREKVREIIIQWNNKQPYHEENEEIEIHQTIDRVFRNRIIVANCIKIKNENSGFPYFGLSELRICHPSQECNKCINPIICWKRKNINKNKKEKKELKFTSLYINEKKKIFAEQVFNEGESKFCIYNFKDESITYENEIIDEDITYNPITDEEVFKGAVLLPSKAEEYESDEKLDNEIKIYINKWLDIPTDALQFALWNIKRSWVFEKFHTLNYLRAMGDTGMGKSRFLDTLGYIHYKPIATSGATTSAPVFRIINKWHGTLIMDEADFTKSDENQDIIKIINQGYEKGKFVMRCDKEDNNKINFFDPYCPKILATRRSFYDKATESRCITQIMEGTNRQDIPLNLNESFWDETLKIRNKLLLWRFRNYYKISTIKEISHDMDDLEPRVKQIVSSFISLFGHDKKQMNQFEIFIKNHQEDIIEERKNSFEGSIVDAIHSLYKEGKMDISYADIIKRGSITNFKGNPLNSRKLSSIMKALGFGKPELRRCEYEVKRCINLEPFHLINLFKRYGNDVTVVTVVTGTPQIKFKVKEGQNELR